MTDLYAVYANSPCRKRIKLANFPTMEMARLYCNSVVSPNGYPFFDIVMEYDKYSERIERYNAPHEP